MTGEQRSVEMTETGFVIPSGANPVHCHSERSKPRSPSFRAEQTPFTVIPSGGRKAVVEESYWRCHTMQKISPLGYASVEMTGDGLRCLRMTVNGLRCAQDDEGMGCITTRKWVALWRRCCVRRRGRRGCRASRHRLARRRAGCASSGIRYSCPAGSVHAFRPPRR